MKVKPSDLAAQAAARFNTTVFTDETPEDVSFAPEVLAIDENMYRTFTDQDLALIGSPTSDGRILASNIDLSFRSFPLPLMWCKQSSGGHLDSYTVGVIEDAKVVGKTVKGSGYFLNTEEADECTTEIAHGVSNPSVDLAGADYIFTDKDGNELDEDELWDVMMEGGDYFVTFTKAEMIGTTLVSTPAFDTKIELDSERSSREVAIVASAADQFRPAVHDHHKFEDPRLSGPTSMTISEDGRIFGHIAVFNECHRSIQDRCQIVPRSPSSYAHFHTSPSLPLDDGSRLPVGRLTVGTGHAPETWTSAPAMAHYDNTGTCFALGRVGEDKHGIWFSGVPAPWATTDQVQEGLMSPLSGDWRDFGQGLDLIAALAVNTPGFAVRGRTDDRGRDVALVASMSPRTKRRGGLGSLSKTDIVDAIVEGVLESNRIASQLVKEAETAKARDAALARARVVVPPPPSPSEQIGELLGKYASKDTPPGNTAQDKKRKKKQAGPAYLPNDKKVGAK